MKRCANCKTEYPATLEYFYAEKRNKDGLRSWCKSCTRTYHQGYYEIHKKQFCARSQEWRNSHRDADRAANRRWKKEHPEQVKAHRRRYYETHGK